MPTRSRSVLIGLSLVALSASLSADVLVVDASGGGDFTDLFPAVVAAAEGDTLFVREGSYGVLFIQGKSLDVAADPLGVVQVTSIEVEGLAVDQRVVLTGLEARVAPTFIARDSEGAIWVQDCVLAQTSGPAPYHGAQASDASNVIFTGCTVEGGSESIDFDGGNGLFMTGRSRVAAWNCTFRGGAGGSLALSMFAGDGGSGVRMWNTGQLYAMGCVFEGAAGGSGSGAGPDGIDGAGATITGQGVAFVNDTAITGGGSAPDVVGPVTDMNESRRLLAAPTVVQSGAVSTWTVTGEPGDLAFVLRSAQPEHVFLPLSWGELALSIPSYAAFEVGLVGPSGQLQLDLPAPTLPAGVDAVLGHHQLIVRTAGAKLVLGSPLAVEVFAQLP